MLFFPLRLLGLAVLVRPPSVPSCACDTELNLDQTRPFAPLCPRGITDRCCAAVCAAGTGVLLPDARVSRLILPLEISDVSGAWLRSIPRHRGPDFLQPGKA